MHRFILIFVCLINSVTSSTDSTQIPSVDTSSFVQSSSTDPTSIPFTTSLSLVHTVSTDNSTTTERSYYPDTYNPGAIVGLIIGSIIFITFMTVSFYCIRRHRYQYLPYYHNYRPG